MALLMKLPNVVINKGKFVYRRRIPTDLRRLYPKTFFETRFRTQEEGAVLVSEHAALQAAFVSMRDDARDGSPEAVGDRGIARYIAKAWADLDDPRTEREKWAGFKEEAEALVRSVRGLAASEHSDDGGDQERREIVADEIERTGGSTLLYRAVTQPEASWFRPRCPVENGASSAALSLFLTIVSHGQWMMVTAWVGNPSDFSHKQLYSLNKHPVGWGHAPRRL